MSETIADKIRETARTVGKLQEAAGGRGWPETERDLHAAKEWLISASDHAENELVRQKVREGRA